MAKHIVTAKRVSPFECMNFAGFQSPSLKPLAWFEIYHDGYKTEQRFKVSNADHAVECWNQLVQSGAERLIAANRNPFSGI